jgi:signal transduction histidine kinase
MFRTFFKRRMLWVGFVAVLVPLTVLLALQYRWLAALEQTWTLAHKTTLDSFLEDVATRVELFYGETGESTLRLPSSVFREGQLGRAADHFRNAPKDVAAVLFAVRFYGEESSTLRMYSPQSKSMEAPADSEQVQAINLAASHWRSFSYRDIPVEAPELSVDERDDQHRLILYPVTDLASRVVGVTGMVVDQAYFRSHVLPSVIREALARFFPEAVRENLIVTVRDSNRQLIYATDGVEGQHDEITRSFNFVFKDWWLGVRSRDKTPEQFARANFTLNVTFSTLLAAVLLSGILLALNAASREIKLSQMKSDFVSNVSHELRTPLAAIRVFGEHLRLGRVHAPEKVREYGEYIDNESRRLTQLINNILDYSRIESGKKEYLKRAEDLAQVAAGVLKTFQVSVRHQGFELSMETPKGPLPQAWIDAEAIAQVIHNLVDNAIKYSGEGRKVEIRLSSSGGWITLAVRDEGIGISRDEQQKIFERFHRVGTGLVHDVKGSGLGLSIVRHVVKKHGGRVEVDSAPGKGSCFYIHLPVYSGAPTRTPDEMPAAVITGGGERG